jgi:uncharacterized protein
MSLKRRQFLLFLGAAASSSALGSVGCQKQTLLGSTSGAIASAASPTGTTANVTSFAPVKGPMPYSALNISADQQISQYAQYSLQDDLVLPEGFMYDVIAAWGDPVGDPVDDARFGYNNDYLSFVPTGPDEGYLTVNFEYISTDTWKQTYEQVIGKSLPFDAIAQAVTEEVDAFTLADDAPLKSQIKEVSKAALKDQGIGVISVRREADGKWVRLEQKSDRRITGISGLEDNRYLKVTGPAGAVFSKTSVKGYTDGLGNKIIGTFGNCAGGTTPWGTVLSAEENFQDQVPEAVHSDGSSFEPGTKAFNNEFDGQGNVLGLAGNKYGWIVEIDPSNPDDYGTKHTWMGRYRHEAVGVRAQAGQQLAFYSGCDRRGGHLYKFVSTGTVTDPTDKANSQLLSDGTLYAAKFNADGTGQWIALNASTPVDPILPSSVIGGVVPLPKRPVGGFESVSADEDAQAFKTQFATLGDLYEGTDEEKQGAILIDAHFAANAAGATATARPEGTIIAKDGTLFTAFTSGTADDKGGPDKAIFVGPNGEADYEPGWIVKLAENKGEPAALSFEWEKIATGGEPSEGGLGFANPDNIAFDSKGDLWAVTDMSTSAHNKAVPQRQDKSGKGLSSKELLGLYGNNSLWHISLSGENAGEAKMFAYGPMECELTGPFFTEDSTTLFLAAQHPGETHGTRKAMASETREFQLKNTAGETFVQRREVPLGSNWPEKGADSPAKPAVVAIRRVSGGSIA